MTVAAMLYVSEIDFFSSPKQLDLFQLTKNAGEMGIALKRLLISIKPWHCLCDLSISGKQLFEYAGMLARKLRQSQPRQDECQSKLERD